MEWTIKRIKVQKDSFKEIHSGDFSGTDFANSDAKEADLVHLKRAVVEGTLTMGGGTPVSCTLVVSLRGNILTFIVKGTGDANSNHLFLIVRRATKNYLAYENKVLAAEIRSDGSHSRGRVTDGLALLDAIHHVRDDGPFEAEI